MNVQAGIRERKKAETRAALRRAALRLALARGVEHVTAEAIAAEADVAPRTFHNYFANKEEAVVAELIERLVELAGALRGRPVGEPVWDSLQHAVVAMLSGQPPEMASVMRMIKASPSLQGPLLAAFDRGSRELARAVAERTGTDAERDLYPRLVADAAAMVLRTATDLWVEEGSLSMVDLASEGIAQMRAGLPEPRASV
jgi:AcrR family transcriptional regulator